VLNCRIQITDGFERTRSWPIISRILMSAGNKPRKFGKPTGVNISGIFCNYCSESSCMELRKTTNEI
jgi:hypothetical protein